MGLMKGMFSSFDRQDMERFSLLFYTKVGTQLCLVISHSQHSLTILINTGAVGRHSTLQHLIAIL